VLILLVRLFSFGYLHCLQDDKKNMADKKNLCQYQVRLFERKKLRRKPRKNWLTQFI